MIFRTTANNMQRNFFNDLSVVDELVITSKNKEFCSMNAHGSFELFDKYWEDAQYHKEETMIALKDKDSIRINDEPPVHFHVDWSEVRYARINKRRLDLIDVDYEIVFCRERDNDSRIFWFYVREDHSIQWLIQKWGRSWLKLSERTATNSKEIKVEYEFDLS